MRKKLIAAAGLLAVGGALALAFSAPASHGSTEAYGCRLMNNGKTVCTYPQ